jgi:hypothetical protein
MNACRDSDTGTFHCSFTLSRSSPPITPTRPLNYSLERNFGSAGMTYSILASRKVLCTAITSFGKLGHRSVRDLRYHRAILDKVEERLVCRQTGRDQVDSSLDLSPNQQVHRGEGPIDVRSSEECREAYD